MCLILFSLNNHQRYKLVVAANRDEFYARPTAPAGFWKDHTHVLAGRDLQANGTWMGINTLGKIAMLTNYRDLSKLNPDAKSRGHIVADFLIDPEINEQDYLQRLTREDDLYNGYNILIGTADSLSYYSNESNEPKMLSSGIYGLSNHLLDSGWPKVEKGKEKLQLALENPEPDVEELFMALYDDIKAPDHLLPDTGVGLELERMLSSMFIKSPDYGSRCSTVVRADKNGGWEYYERTYNPTDFSYTTVHFQFQEKPISR